jgi:hypothetical protein
MNLANSRATLGLTTKATPTSTAVNGSVQIGDNPQTLTFSNADVAYSLRAFFAAGSPELDLELTTGVTTGSTAFVEGAAQVETATAAGTASASGNVTTTVTSAGMAGSPLAITTAILNGDTAATWAGKVRTTLAANATIAARFTVGGTSTSIVLTRKPGDSLTDGNETVNLFLATDATLNIALAGPSGVSAAPTSAGTVVGTVTSGVLIRDGDGKDFEGVTIPTLDVNGVLFVNSDSGNLLVGSNDLTDMPIAGNSSVLFASSNSSALLSEDSALTISGSSTILTITVLGTDAS